MVNVTPHSEMDLDLLSQFNLVFGRKPRLSPQDICFPAKSKPLSLPDDPSRTRYLIRLHKTLENMCFDTRETTLEAKEDIHSNYDKYRVGTVKTKGLSKLIVGDRSPTNSDAPQTDFPMDRVAFCGNVGHPHHVISP